MQGQRGACDCMRCHRVSRIRHEQVACFWRSAQAISVDELVAPAWSNAVLDIKVLERLAVLLGLNVQVVLQVLVQGPMFVLLEVCETQAGIQAVHIEAPFCFRTTIATEHERVLRPKRDQELRGTSEPGTCRGSGVFHSFPEDQWWIRCCESDEVLEEVVLLDEVCLEQGPVSGPRGVEVMAQGLRNGSSTARV